MVSQTADYANSAAVVADCCSPKLFAKAFHALGFRTSRRLLPLTYHITYEISIGIGWQRHITQYVVRVCERTSYCVFCPF